MTKEQLEIETINVGDVICDNFFTIRVESVTLIQDAPVPYVVYSGAVLTKSLKPTKSICSKYKIVLDKEVKIIKKQSYDQRRI